MSAECFSSLFNQSLRDVSVCGFKSTIWSWTNFSSFVERMQRCGTLQIEALFFYTYLCHFMVVSSRALHPSVGRSFSHLEQTFPCRGPPCTVWLLHAAPPGALNGPLCDWSIPWLLISEWAALWSTIPWLLVGLAPARASFDGAVFLEVSSQGSLLALHCFTLAYRRDCFSKFNVESICSFSDSVTSLIPTTMQSWIISLWSGPCSQCSARLYRAVMNESAVSLSICLRWLKLTLSYMTLHRLIKCRSKQSRTLPYFSGPLLRAQTNEECRQPGIP